MAFIDTYFVGDHEPRELRPDELVFAQHSAPEAHGRFFAVTPLAFFQETGYQFDQEINCKALTDADFEEVCEGEFEFAGEGDPVQLLESLGVKRDTVFEKFINSLIERMR